MFYTPKNGPGGMQKAQPAHTLEDLKGEIARLKTVERDPAVDKKFVEEWKKRSKESVGVIFVSLPIEGPEIRGELKREAVESVMRVVWPATGKGMTGEEKRRVLRANFDAIRKYTSDLVDKTVAEKRDTAAFR